MLRDALWYEKLEEVTGFKRPGKQIPRNSHVPIMWKCKLEHPFEKSANNIYRGSGCPECAVGSRRKKLQLESSDYHKLAGKRKMIWKGPFVSNARTKTNWECIIRARHRYPATYGALKKSKGCKYCHNRVRKMERDYHIVGKKLGIIWLGKTLPANIKAKTPWECEQGHPLKKSYHSISQSDGCWECGVESRKQKQTRTLEELYKLTDKGNVEWLDTGKKVPTSHQHTVFRGKLCGHIFSTTLAALSQGHGCPECGIQSRADKLRLKPSAYKKLGEKFRFEWLGPQVQTTIDLTNWLCRRAKHKCRKSYNEILRGRGCAQCVTDSQRLKSSDYHALARSLKGWKWIGKQIPNNAHEPTKWICNKGHELSLSHTNLKTRKKCWKCSGFENGKRISEVQRQLADVIVRLFSSVPYELNRRCGKRWIDIALDLEQPIAIEYDSWYYHAHSSETDNLRDKNHIAHGYRVLRIQSNKGIPTDDKLMLAIEKLITGSRKKTTIRLKDWGQSTAMKKA